MLSTKDIKKYKIPVYTNYTVFTSEVSQLLRRIGDAVFVENSEYLVDLDEITQNKNKKHLLYYVATVEYISNINNIKTPLWIKDLALTKMENLTFSEGVERYYRVTQKKNYCSKN